MAGKRARTLPAAPAAATPPAARAAFPLLAFGLVLAAFLYRLQAEVPPAAAGPGGCWFADNDTVRRLVRREALDAAGEYPPRETNDGFPGGTVSHWTRPQDWVLRALDGPGRLLFPRAAPGQGGALLSGPLLSALAVGLLLAGARRLVGPWPALAAGLLYAFSRATTNLSWLGNGDHQNLQHLLLLTALIGAALAREREGRLWAALSGAGVGAALWVSTETQILLLLAGSLFLAGEARRALRPEAAPPFPGGAWGAGLAGVLLLGHLVENPGQPLALAWDRISLLQLLPAAALALFLGLRSRQAGAGLKPLGLALAPAALLCLAPLLLPGFRAALSREAEAFRAVNPWLQAAVSEFRSLLTDGAGFSLRPAVERFTWLLPGLPLFLWGVAATPALKPGTRRLLLAWIAAALGLAVWEVKLSHLFAPLFALAVAGGGAWWLRRLLPDAARLAPAWPRAGAALLAGLAAWAARPEPPGRDPLAAHTERCLHDLCLDLRRLGADRGGEAVLAPWELGAKLLYYAGAPVVASGYHRNWSGIADGYRVFLARPGVEEDAARRILKERRVRLVVVWFNRLFLAHAPALLGRTEPLAAAGPAGLELAPAARETLYWRLRYGPPPAGFREAARSAAEIAMSREGEPEPIYRIFAVE